MPILRHFALSAMLFVGFATQGGATTLSYSADSVIEFDSYYHLPSFLSEQPHGPDRARRAALHINFDQVLAADSFYTVGRSRTSSQHQLINDFTLSVETEDGTYALSSSYRNMFELELETGAGGRLDYWSISWNYSSGADYFEMSADGGSAQVSWLWEYMRFPGDTDASGLPVVYENRLNRRFSPGRMIYSPPSSSQPPVSPVPLPAGAVLMLSGCLALLRLKSRRRAAV